MSQLSALPPKTLDSLTAISGEIPRFPFTSSNNVVRVTPSAAAASVMVKPRGSMPWRKTKAPGGMDSSSAWVRFLVSGNQHNQRPVLVFGKMKDHPPVRADGSRPKAFQIALEWMQFGSLASPYIRNGTRRIEAGLV